MYFESPANKSLMFFFYIRALHENMCYVDLFCWTIKLLLLLLSLTTNISRRRHDIVRDFQYLYSNLKVKLYAKISFSNTFSADQI